MLVKTEDISLTVRDIVEAEFKLTSDHYLERFQVAGRVDLDLRVSPEFYRDVLLFRQGSGSITDKLLGVKPKVLGTRINLGFAGVVVRQQVLLGRSGRPGPSLES